MRQVLPGALAVAALALGAAACSNSTPAGSPVVPVPAQAVRAPGAIAAAGTGQSVSYALTQRSQIETWAGPSAKPVSSSASDTGTETDTMTPGGSGTFTLLTKTAMNSGSQVRFTLNGQTVANGGTSSEYFYADSYAGTDVQSGAGATYSGKDRWPDGELGVVFPLTAGSSWDSVGLDNSSIDTLQYATAKDGKRTGAREKGDFSQQPTGFYTGHDAWSVTPGAHREYAERFDASSRSSLAYELTMPGYSPERWSFGQPASGRIPVSVTGHGNAPFPQGTKDVPVWYPGGRLPANLIADRLTVMRGSVAPPAACKLSGKVPAVRETWSVLDPVAGGRSSGVNTYYGWSGSQPFPACVVESSTSELVANGIWYVDWLTGKPYYRESDTLLEVRTGGAAQAVRPGAGAPARAWFGLPLEARQHALAAHLAAVRLALGRAPGS